MNTWVIVHFAVTLYMVGLIWFVQNVHYPLFLKVPDESRPSYCVAHIKYTNTVVILPMFVELVTAVYLVYQKSFDWLWTSNLFLLILIWVSTFVLQVPLHKRLVQKGLSVDAKLLVRTNWVRTVLWSVRAALVFYFIVSFTRQAQTL